MLVVIPTYKRNECLRWVLQSLVQCRTEKIDDLIRVLVVNNYPPAAEEIKAIVDEFIGYTQYKWQILYREKTLEPVDNWYSAIFSHAKPDEVVIINSDDDLLLPLSLETRYLAITGNKADMALGNLGPNIFFSENGTRILCTEYIGQSNVSDVNEVFFANVAEFSPQHLSNHCYRNTSLLREAYNLAMSWSGALSWLDYNNKTIHLPMYLTFALLHIKGQIIGIKKPMLLRGRDVEEIRNAQFGVRTWNQGFIHAVALVVMDNTALRPVTELDGLRKLFLGEYIRWFPTYFFDKRISLRAVIKAQQAANIQWKHILSSDLMVGLGLVVKNWLGLRGLKLSKLARKQSISSTEFLHSIDLEVKDKAYQ